MFKSKWNLLYVVLVVLIAFSLFAVPKITVSSMNATKGKIVTVQPQ